MEDRILQITKTLDLLSIKSRSYTINSLVESILYLHNVELSFDEIIIIIHNIFNIKPFFNEIDESIKHSVSLGEIIVKKGKYILSQDKYAEIHDKELNKQYSEKQRFIRFRDLVDSIIIFENIDIDINKLWTIFIDYLYECLYQYGENAVNHFLEFGLEEEYIIYVDSDPFINAIHKLSSEKSRIFFKEVCVLFFQKINNDEIQYLESLSKKTVAFHSLCLPIELHDEIIDLNIRNWNIAVDVNFLFSVVIFMNIRK